MKTYDEETEQGVREWAYQGIPFSIKARAPIQPDFVKQTEKTRIALKGKFKSNFSKNNIIDYSYPKGYAFLSPRMVVRNTNMVENGLVQEASRTPPTHTIISNRKFGLKPLDKTNTIRPRTFARFEKIVNRMIRAGASLPDHLFEKKTLESVMPFYHAVRRTPSLEILWEQRKTSSLKLHNRTWRCAAQFAYFALREGKREARLIQQLTRTLKTSPNLLNLFEGDFPQREVYKEVYVGLRSVDLELTKGQFTRVYLGNVLRQIRNTAKRGLRTRDFQTIEELFNDFNIPPYIEQEMALWLTINVKDFLKSYLRVLSGRITRRVKHLLKSSKNLFTSRNKGLDSLINKILIDTELSIDTLNAKDWEKVRKRWRDSMFYGFQRRISEIDMEKLANRALSEALAGLSPERVLNLLFNLRPSGMKLEVGDLEEFKQYLVRGIISEIEYRLITLLKPQVLPIMQKVLYDLQNKPHEWLKLPQFQKQTIPFGLDDGGIYLDNELREIYILALHKRGVPIDEIALRLIKKQKRKKKEDKAFVEKIHRYVVDLIENDKKSGRYKRIKKKKDPLLIQLRLEKGKLMWFSLRTPKRFLRMIEEGFAPQKATLMKKRGGGLMLAIPFEKEVLLSSYPEPSDQTQKKNPSIIAGLDLGLKTLGVLSIAEGRLTTQGAWEQVGQELARYFIDQKQLSGKRNDWYNNNPLKKTQGNSNVFNAKRRLTNLQLEARVWQSKRDNYRNALQQKRIDHCHARKFFELNRHLNRIWQKVQNIHEELARQVATRIIAACEHHYVGLLRVEDLRWAKHTRKQKTGYFLTT